MYAPLCLYGMTFLKDKDQVEELVQDVFVKLWEKRDQLQIQTSLKSYLYTSVKNSILNYIKSQKVRSSYANEMQQQEEPTYLSVDDFENIELQNRIENLVNAMPTERLKVFKLSRYEGLKYKEIAQKLGISIKTVENQMGKALKYLRENLADVIVLFVSYFLIDYIF